MAFIGQLLYEDKGGGGLKVINNPKLTSENKQQNLIRPQVRRAIAQCDTWEVGVCDPNLDHPIISTQSSKN